VGSVAERPHEPELRARRAEVESLAGSRQEERRPIRYEVSGERIFSGKCDLDE
jgi:hypothetical protein